jgi:hypothetical protein
LSAVATAATEAISAAVKELEAVAASYLEQKTPAPAEPAPAEKAAPFEPEAPQTGEARAEESLQAVAAEAGNPNLETSKLDAREIGLEERNQPESEEPKNEETKSEEPKGEAPSVASVAAAEPEEASRTNAETPETPAPAFVNEVPAERTSASQVSDMAALAVGQPAAADSGDLAKGESEAAETTAAAWANWRRIRESGSPSAASQESAQPEVEDKASGLQDAAARAVAAGAEKTPDEASAASESDPAAIASIVDSVIADLRPKIYEEISRKMGKKK